MDLWEFLKFVHVAAAISWVGGAVTLEVVGFRVARRADTRSVMGFARDAEIVGRLYGVSTVLVLGFGIWMVIDSPAIDFTDAWILISLNLTALLFLMGPCSSSRAPRQSVPSRRRRAATIPTSSGASGARWWSAGSTA